jgi:hypothetical protein
MTQIAADKTKEIIALIRLGTVDDNLEQISDAIQNRRHISDTEKIYDFNKGDTVVFNSQARPQYLQGLTATIVRINRVRVVLSTPDAFEYRRFRNSKALTCPVSIIDKMEE